MTLVSNIILWTYEGFSQKTVIKPQWGGYNDEFAVLTLLSRLFEPKKAIIDKQEGKGAVSLHSVGWMLIFRLGRARTKFILLLATLFNIVAVALCR